MPILSSNEDAFGHALLDYFHGRSLKQLTLETDAGDTSPAMPASWFFEPPQNWVEWERSALTSARGPVLDLGAGAGRASLYMQERGHEAVAIDNSPGAIQVCKERGIADARLHDFAEELPTDKPWQTVLLLCGNFGLAGSWDATRQLLSQLRDICADDAVLLADTVDPSVMSDPNVQRYQQRMVAKGEYVGNVTLRLMYGEIRSPWWRLTNVLIADVPRIIEGTGWRLDDHRIEGMDHYLRLRRD